jgi:O-methyltransferase involved in polyketide biosynthesis
VVTRRGRAASTLGAQATARSVPNRSSVLHHHESANLLYEQERTEVVDWLSVNGWDVSAVTAPDLMARNGRVVPSDLEDATPESVFVAARLP